jgi:Dynamin family
MATNSVRVQPITKVAAFGGQSFNMKHPKMRNSLLQSLESAQRTLEGVRNSYPVLQAPYRALGRIARAASRPMRLAILGESNSGKSTLANLLVGDVMLPALPAANTRLPTLLQYAPSTFAAAVLANGQRFALGAKGGVPPGQITRLEAGLPNEVLRLVEIVDFPGGANPLLPTDPLDVLSHGIDAAIWTTVATQAWRESERAAWLRLPQRIRSLGLLAVTHCDLISTAEDFRRLRARLDTVARPHFQGVFFVAAIKSNETSAVEWADNAALFSETQRLAHQFSSERFAKAALVTRLLAATVLERLGEKYEPY